jgi:ribose transport system substrate-binding protein
MTPTKSLPPKKPFASMPRMKWFSILAALCLCVTSCRNAPRAQLTIGASLLTGQHPFYVSLIGAMKEEAQKNGVKLDVVVANQDLNKQISDVEDFLNKRVDGIILSPVDSRGVKAAVLKAQQAGIPVITVDIAAQGVDVTAHVASDNYAGGVKAGQLMAKVLGGKGEIAIIDYPVVQSVIDRVSGFRQAISAFPGIKMVAVQPGITRAEALAAAQNILQAHPGLDGIFGFSDDAALASVVAAKSAGVCDRIKIVGFDGLQEARDAVDRKPCFAGLIRQYPDRMGAVAVQTTLQVLRGQQVQKSILVPPGVYVKQGQN